MLRLVRLSYPNSIRGQLFTEFAMETANDSIKYIKPVYTKNAGEWAGEGTAFTKGDTAMPSKYDGEFGADGLGDVMYESTESRYATEMVKATAGSGTASTNDGKGTIKLTALNPVVDGYTQIFVKDVTGANVCAAIQQGDKIFADPAGVLVKEGPESPEHVVITGIKLGEDGKTYTVTYKHIEAEHTTDLPHANVTAYTRYDSEQDLRGEYLGEVELTMQSYAFRPRPITLGVTWTQLTELVLDTSFGVSAEEMLMDSAAQEIKKTLDFQAVKFANNVQRTNGMDVVTFDAEPGAGVTLEKSAYAVKDGYYHTAQIIQQAISRVGDVQLNKMNRGGVTAIVGGPAAVNYLGLNEHWSDTGRQPAIGGHKVGEIDGKPVFKVPAGIIADDELLTVWKNDANESDVAIAIGTLLPFYSTGALQRKNLYKEAAVARFEDTKCLQKDYLGRIKIKNLRTM